MSEELRIWRPQDQATRRTWALLALVVAGGAVLRFWGLGNIGLHGDEDVMALAARGILETGAPTIPSGMLYPRALPQLYLMASSVAAFGDSEWALRLPSALMGTLMVLIGYFLARRFLSVRWSILFAAVIALLPGLIVLSQTARMYVFYVGFVMLFGVAIFRWERTGATRDWLYAVGACVAALLFHSLAVFASLLFFYPGLVKRSGRFLVLGAAGFAIGGVVFKVVSEWNSAQYFPLVSAARGAPGAPPESLQHPVGLLQMALAAALIACIAAAAWLAGRRRDGAAERLWFTAGVALLATAAVSAGLIQYHLAGLAWFFGTIFYLRAGGKAGIPAVLGVALLGLFGWHAYEASSTPGVRGFYDFAEALLGNPKPLSYLTFSGFAPLGVAAYALLLVYFAAGFARGRALPDHVLLFLVAVFAPLFLMGFFEERFLPPRYVIGMLPFFILAFFAGIRQVLADLAGRLRPKPALVHGIAGLLALALLVNPSELRYNVNPQYADFARLSEHRGVDHRGAAEYVMARGSDEEDLVIVMDAQQQGYYLPERTDYYMRSLHVGRNSSIMRDGRMLNLYTGIPQIASGEALAKVVRESDYNEILVVGSGEIEHNRMLHMSAGIWATMQELGFEQAWLGRDGATPIWRYMRQQSAVGADASDSDVAQSQPDREPD